MNRIGATIRPTVRHLLLWLIVTALLLAAWPAAAQDPDGEGGKHDIPTVSAPPQSQQATAPTAPQNPDAVLWSQPLSGSNHNAYANQDFADPTNNAYDIFIADDFTNADSWIIDTIFVPGNTWKSGATGCDLTCANTLHWEIYDNAGGAPDGDPSGGGNAPVWSLSLSPTSSQVTISSGVDGWRSNVNLSLNTPINLPPGTWWLVFYPTMEFTPCCQYGRHVADTTNGYTAQVINPGGGFGFPTTWAPVTDSSTWDLNKRDFAFRLEGRVSDVGPLEYDSHTVDDDDYDNSSGNGDGEINPGETIELYVTLRNQGTDTATGVGAHISTSDPYVTWLYNTSSGYPDIPGGGTGTNTDDFDFEVDPSCPVGHRIHFYVDITANNGGPWSDDFYVTVRGVVGPVEYAGHDIDDDNSGNSSGNDNGEINPGETIEQYVTLCNRGSDTAADVEACISENSPYVDGFMYNTCSSYGDIPGGACNTNSDDFDFEVDPNCPCGHVIQFDLDITASNGGPWADSFGVTVVCVEPDIEVSPTSFNVTLPSGQSTQRTLTIDNVGQGTLYFDIHDEETGTSSQREPTIPTPPAGEVDTEGHVVGFAGWDWAALREGREPSVSLDILYYGTSSSEASRFAALGATVTRITDPSAISQAYLNQFDVFFVGYAAEEDYGSLASQATAIQNYISNGGGVILEQPSQTGYQCQFLPAGFEVTVADTYWPGYPNLDSLEFTSAGQTHLMLQGLTPDDLSGNFDTVYDSGLGSSYTRLARLASNHNVIALAVGQHGNGRIVFQTNNLSSSSADPGSDAYVEQMLEWAAGGSDSDAAWLSENPTSGTVTGGGSQEVDVIFDATGLAPGTYTADIIIANNDPDENPVTVPATLHVTSPGNPVILTIEDGSGPPGSTGNPVTISADNQSQNQTPIAAGEFWVIYDSTIGLDLADVRTTSRSSGFYTDVSTDTSDPSAVEAHILLYSLSNATIAPGTGPILELLFDVDPAAQTGDCSTLSHRQAVLSDQQGSGIPVDYSDTGQFCVGGCDKDGDINDDGDVNVLDVQILLNMILHQPQPDPNLYALDWWCRGDLAPCPNGDDQWNIYDLQRLICIILSPPCTCARGGVTGSRGENTVSIEEVYANPGTSGAFDIDCDNQDAIAAAEVWFTYDSTIGLNVSDAMTTTSRTDGWTVVVAEPDQSDPSAVEMHVLLFNMDGWSIDAGTGALLSVPYEVDADGSGDSPLDITQVNLSDAQGQPLPAKEEDGMFHITEQYEFYLPLIVKDGSP